MPQSIIVNNRRYALDRKVDRPHLKASLPRFREAYPTVPDNQLAESDQFGTFDPPTLDQIQNGCVGHGGSTMMWMLWVAMGNDPVDFSPTWLYALTNGGIDEGAQIGGLLPALQNVGLCTARTFPEDKYMLGGPAEKLARPEAANYRVDDGYLAYSWEEVVTAQHHGYQVADSVMVGDDFLDRLTSVGGLPVVPDDRGPGNHCVVSGGLLRYQGTVYRRRKTSWGDDTPLGKGGIFLTTREHDESQGNGFSAVVVRTAKPMPAAPPIPTPI